ncbi:hypothetical protein RND71_041211 [Anisodus tanguticus]|uniref:NHL repeat-containing protein 2 n=1 Tax=Anisodus tanguticus TaxID=243964 RepID=A0AAE1QTP6_9SOLA|nr:hypothetical protein RND71_041211 [Anisodus tanguticus]
MGLKVNACQNVSAQWGKVSAVLFDMDGVLCNSEEPSRKAAVDVFAEMGVHVTLDDFVPFTGMGFLLIFLSLDRRSYPIPVQVVGEANFLGGVASAKGVEGFDTEAAKKRFFEIYLLKYAKPNSGIGFPGAFELVSQCKSNGLKVAVASSADRIKVDANLAAAGLPITMFDAIVSADAFKNLKPAPDIFLSASRILDVPTSECIVIEDALAGVQAAKAAKMRCIAVTTTLSEDTLKAAEPSLIKKEISDISFEDILNGGSGSHNEMVQESQSVNDLALSSSESNMTESITELDNYPTSGAVSSIGGQSDPYLGLANRLGKSQDGLQLTLSLLHATDDFAAMVWLPSLCLSKMQYLGLKIFGVELGTSCALRGCVDAVRPVSWLGKSQDGLQLRLSLLHATGDFAAMARLPSLCPSKSAGKKIKGPYLGRAIRMASGFVSCQPCVFGMMKNIFHDEISTWLPLYSYEERKVCEVFSHGVVAFSLSEQNAVSEPQNFPNRTGDSLCFKGSFGCWVQVTRRNVVRYGSLGIAASCLLFTITNWKAMQYASPKAIWNLLFGTGNPPFGQKEDASSSQRIQQFVNYISDVDARKSTTIVPEFPSKLDWLNTAPLQLGRDLKGKVVLLDFWTYCCINCMHVLPDLEFLEKKYKDMPVRLSFTLSPLGRIYMDMHAIVDVGTTDNLRFSLDRGASLQQYNFHERRESEAKKAMARLSRLQFHGALDYSEIQAKIGMKCVLLIANAVKGEGNANEFVVVGVHSAKFDNEKDLEAIRSAVLRYGITHPVVNDGEMNLWRELGVNSWPTFVLVGPNGKLLAQIAGEGHRKDLDYLVEAALQFYGKKKLLDSKPIPLRLEKDNDPRLLTSPLKFPGKLAVDVLNNRLFISDSNHNRIVVADLDGNFLVQVGSTGAEGLRDGNFDDATFNRPQGLAYNAKKNLLYVADTENHALRVIDFVNETVETLAGNGTKGSDYEGGGTGTAQARLDQIYDFWKLLLNSPWDVCFEPENEIVYIAMAGQHQIWEHKTSDGVTRAFSGNGYERNLNGSSSTSTSYAQPSGISLSRDLKEAYIADSESSSIRAVDLRTGGSRPLAGGDPVFAENLFKFGDHDGIGSEVLLQHPLGVFCGKDGQIYIADSYNHKIKKLDPVSKRVTTLAGVGQAGFKDGAAVAAQFSEPSGIVEAENGRLYIADTNNSVIRYLDLNKSEAEVLTLELKGVQPPLRSRSLKRLRRRSGADTQTVIVNGGSSNEGTLNLRISVPEGYHFSKEAQSKFSIDFDPDNAAEVDSLEENLSPEGSAVVHFRRSSASSSTARVYCKVYYCKEDEVCLYQSLTFEVPFQEVNPDSAPAMITLPFDVKPKTSKNIPSGLQIPVSARDTTGQGKSTTTYPVKSHNVGFGEGRAVVFERPSAQGKA